MIPRSFCALVDLPAGRPVAVLAGAGCSTDVYRFVQRAGREGRPVAIVDPA